MLINSISTRIFNENERLDLFITEHIPTLRENSVIVVTSKIVALAEGRTALITDKISLIKKESQWHKPTKYVIMTIKDGMLMASAGIDESNAKDKIILLPKNSFSAASKLRSKLMAFYKIKNLGILISDSRSLPLRAGSVGVAIGYAGFKGLHTYTNKKDLFGRQLKVTNMNLADSLAAASVLMMGEGDEKMPLAVIENAPVYFQSKVNPKELLIAVDDDLYGDLFKKIIIKN